MCYGNMPPREYTHYNFFVGITGFGCPSGKCIKPTDFNCVVYRIVLILFLPIMLPIPLLFGPVVGLIMMLFDNLNGLKSTILTAIMKLICVLFGIPICLVLGIFIGAISLLMLPVPIIISHFIKLLRFLYYTNSFNDHKLSAIEKEEIFDNA